MNKELEDILKEAETKLSLIEKKQNLQYLETKEEVVKLQKQLLSASVLGKENLARDIKINLKQVELKLFSLNEDKRELELAFLHKYIKEHYD